MPNTRTKSVATDFSAGVGESMLHAEIAGALTAASATVSITGITVLGDVVTLQFDGDPTTWDATIDATVAAHAGADIPKTKNHMAVGLVVQDFAVTDSVGFELVAGITSRPDFFAGNLAAAFGQLLGKAKVAGTGAQIKVTETLADGTVTDIIAAADIADTAGLWTVVNLLSAPGAISTGYNEYALMATLGAATSFTLRGVSCAVLEYV